MSYVSPIDCVKLCKTVMLYSGKTGRLIAENLLVGKHSKQNLIPVIEKFINEIKELKDPMAGHCANEWCDSLMAYANTLPEVLPPVVAMVDEYSDDLKSFNVEITPLLLEFKAKLDDWFVSNKVIYQHNWRGFCDRAGCVPYLDAENLRIVDEIKNMNSAGRFRVSNDEQRDENRRLWDLIEQKRPGLYQYI